MLTTPTPIEPEPGPPPGGWTWANITPEQYEISPFITGWPWCAPGEFPLTYKWEAPCVPVDPCQDTVEFGGATLWGGEPCDLAAHPVVIERGAADPTLQTPDTPAPEPATDRTGPVAASAPASLAVSGETAGASASTESVAVLTPHTAPPMLPATGPTETLQIGLVGTVVLLVGVLLKRASHG